MSEPLMEAELYGAMLNDETFLNDLWNEFGATDKFETLRLAGWTDEKLKEAWQLHISNGDMRINEE